MSPEWFAHITISATAEGFFHLYCRTEGDSKDAVLAGAVFIKDTFSNGNAVFMRAEPEAVTETDFDTKEVKHRGFVRFSFK